MFRSEGNKMTITSRGSEWHRWEPNVHVPGTVLEDRYAASEWEAYLLALETASTPRAAIGITADAPGASPSPPLPAQILPFLRLSL